MVQCSQENPHNFLGKLKDINLLKKSVWLSIIFMIIDIHLNRSCQHTIGKILNYIRQTHKAIKTSSL